MNLRKSLSITLFAILFLGVVTCSRQVFAQSPGVISQSEKQQDETNLDTQLYLLVATNQDVDDHDVTSDTGAWSPFVVLPGESGSLVFSSAGTFPYRDSLYAPLGMTGSITVNAVVPPTLSAPVRPNSSQFRFTISGTAGRTYTIETSGNLTNWTAIATNVAPSNIFNYTNSNATNLTRFYRVKDGT